MTRGQKTLAALIVLFSLAHLVDTHDHTQRNFEFLPGMVESIPYDAQDPSPVFADGKTLQAPPAGTIARGHLPLHAGGRLLDVRTEWKQLSKADQLAWDKLTGPPPRKDGGDVARGRQVFAQVCATCHGMAGAGDGETTKRGVPPPPALTAQGAKEMSDGRMFRIITVGQANMAAHGAQVRRADRWNVIRFVRTLQGGQQ